MYHPKFQGKHYEMGRKMGDIFKKHNAQFPIKLEPSLSRVAMTDGSIIGHILFTRVSVNDPGGREVSTAILTPLAVHPDFQSLGTGGQLIGEGLRQLLQAGVDFVFVLGHPSYYP